MTSSWLTAVAVVAAAEGAEEEVLVMVVVAAAAPGTGLDGKVRAGVDELFINNLAGVADR